MSPSRNRVVNAIIGVAVPSFLLGLFLAYTINRWATDGDLLHLLDLLIFPLLLLGLAVNTIRIVREVP